MAWLCSGSGRRAISSNLVRGEGVYLRPPEMRDYRGLGGFAGTKPSFLTPWEPTWPGDDLTRTSFRRRLRRHMQEIASDEAYPFLIFRDGDDALVGGLTIGQIKRGVAQSATLGYWMGAPICRQGADVALRPGDDGLRLHQSAAASDRGRVLAA